MCAQVDTGILGILRTAFLYKQSPIQPTHLVLLNCQILNIRKAFI